MGAGLTGRSGARLTLWRTLTGGLGLTQQGLLQLATLVHVCAGRVFTRRRALAACRCSATALAPDRRIEHAFGHFEVDLALVQIDTHDPHFHAVAQTEVATTALTRQTVMHGIEVVVIARQRGDVHQAFDVDIFQLDEQAKARHRSDHALEGFADAILHELALEPVDDVTGRFISAPLGQRALLAQLLQRRLIVRIDARARHRHGAGTTNVRSI